MASRQLVTNMMAVIGEVTMMEKGMMVLVRVMMMMRTDTMVTGQEALE